MKRLVLALVLAAVGCKGKESPAPEPANAAAANSAAVQAGLAAAALAQAAASLAAAAGGSAATTPSATTAVASAAASAKPVASAETSAFSAQVANQLGRLGFSTGASDLLALGRDRAALLTGLGRLAAQPTALAAVFDNDSVVSAFMKRADVQQFCRDPEQLKHVLLYALSSPAARSWVSSPDSVKALTTSKLGQQFQACSAFKTLAKDPRTLASLTNGNAAATAVVSNPNFRAELDRLKIKQDAQAPRSFKKVLSKP
jgi:hypothetical protein